MVTLTGVTVTNVDCKYDSSTSALIVIFISDCFSFFRSIIDESLVI